jgi:hypothetical protein
MRRDDAKWAFLASVVKLITIIVENIWAKH